MSLAKAFDRMNHTQNLLKLSRPLLDRFQIESIQFHLENRIQYVFNIFYCVAYVGGIVSHTLKSFCNWPWVLNRVHACHVKNRQ